MYRDYVPSGLMEVDLADPIVVIPMIPIDNSVTVLDVTELSSKDRNDVLQSINEYHKYIKLIQETILSYEEWNTRINTPSPVNNLKRLVVSRNIVSRLNKS